MSAKQNNPDDNRLMQMTIRIPKQTRTIIESLAEKNKCSASEIVRMSVEDNLEKHLSSVEYVDKEQGDAVKLLLSEFNTGVSVLRTELNRIGCNVNQQTKVLNSLESLYRQGRITLKEFIDESAKIKREYGDSPFEHIETLLNKYESISEEVIEAVYTRITHSKNARSALAYANGKCGHNGNAKRNILIGSVGMLPDEIVPFAEQMELDLAHASSRNKNQVRRIIASFSEKELSPDDSDAAYKALDISTKFITEAYPDRKCAIFVQNDGKSGLWHTHMIVCNVDTLNYRGCTPRQTSFRYVQQMYDRIAGRFLDLDKGTKAKDKISQCERHLLEENQEAADNGETAPNVLWKEALKERIRIAMNKANSRDTFREELAFLGVDSRFGKSKEYGEYISYELLDIPKGCEASAGKCKARSYKLGDDYGAEALDRSIERNLYTKNKALVSPAKQEDVTSSTASSNSDMQVASVDEVVAELTGAPDTEKDKSELTAYEKMLHMKEESDKRDYESLFKGFEDFSYSR